MKKDEIVKLLNYLNTYYNKRFELPDNKGKMKMMVETWSDFLGEYQSGQVKTATKKLVTEKEWPPTPGEIMKEIEELKMSEEDKLTGPEAWEALCHAIQRHGRYHEQELLDSLPERVARAAQVTGMETIYMQGGDSFIQNRFIKTYEQLQERDFERQMLPGSARKDIERIGAVGKKQIEQLTDEFKGGN
jgi:hypothetical protein